MYSADPSLEIDPSSLGESCCQSEARTGVGTESSNAEERPRKGRGGRGKEARSLLEVMARQTQQLPLPDLASEEARGIFKYF